MTNIPNVDQAREAARQANGEFGTQEHARPTRGLPVPPDDLLTAFDGKSGFPFEEFYGWDCDSDVDFMYEANNICAVLQEVHGNSPEPGGFIFEADHDEDDGSVETYKIGVSLDDGTYLATDLHPMSDLGAEGVHGREAALLMANHLDKQYRELRAMAVAGGKLKPATEKEHRANLLDQYRKVNRELDESTIRLLSDTAEECAPGADTLVVSISDQGLFVGMSLDKDNTQMVDLEEAWGSDDENLLRTSEAVGDLCSDLSENGYWTNYATRLPNPFTESYAIDLKAAKKAGLE